MTIHAGKIYKTEDVSLRKPDINLIKKTDRIIDTELDWNKWRRLALTDDSVYYFAVYNGEETVGEIFLHDINLDKKDSLVGYHIFYTQNRGKGIGAKALHLLQQYVGEETSLKKLIIITGENNIPSRKIAEKCGFIFTGSSWEDPHKIVYEWNVEREK